MQVKLQQTEAQVESERERADALQTQIIEQSANQFYSVVECDTYEMINDGEADFSDDGQLDQDIDEGVGGTHLETDGAEDVEDEEITGLSEQVNLSYVNLTR